MGETEVRRDDRVTHGGDDLKAEEFNGHVSEMKKRRLGWRLRSCSAEAT